MLWDGRIPILNSNAQFVISSQLLHIQCLDWQLMNEPFLFFLLLFLLSSESSTHEYLLMLFQSPGSPD
jgi:hypothetical protein